ncbi:hypothetical protein, partial [Ralstonia solanacearum]|uniref:hypothetical protein n=1 Tax=Ralstonia solanacearum TaxID=305 RepID=UPI0035EA3F05
APARRPLLDPFGSIRLPPTQNPLRIKDKTPHSEKCGVRQQSESPLMRALFADGSGLGASRSTD